MLFRYFGTHPKDANHTAPKNVFEQAAHVASESMSTQLNMQEFTDQNVEKVKLL